MTAKDGTVRGGHREGAGDKPGNRFTAAQTALGRQRRLERDAANRQTPPPYVTVALRLRLAGYGDAEIGRRIGRPRTTVVTWCNRHKAWLQTEREAMLADAQRSFSPLLEPTLKAFADALDSESMTHRLRAAEGAADRIWGSTVPAGSTPGNTTFSITYIDGSSTYVMPTRSQALTIEHEPAEPSTDDDGSAKSH